MIRILIADDEGLMRESIRNAIRSSFGSKCEIEIARTGREVVEQCMNFRPDIAFVDIQMPGLSGIRAIEEVRKKDTSIIFIIITAYDRFSYAQEAISLGVQEFLMKPVTKSRITDACARAIYQVEEQRKRRSDDLRVREKLEIVVPMIEDAFISNLMQEDKNGGNPGYLKMLDYPQESGYVVTLEFGEEVENGILTNAVGSNVRMNKNYAHFKEIVSSYLSCVTGPVMGNRVILYVPFDTETAQYDQRVEIISRVRMLLRRLEADLELRFRAGIGDVRKAEDAYASYRESTRSLRQESGHVVHVKDISAAEPENSFPEELAERYLQLGMKADREGAGAAAEELCQWMQDVGQYSVEDMAMKMLELLLLLEQKAQDAGTLRRERQRRENYLTEIRAAEDPALLRKWFLNRTGAMCDEIATSRQRDSGNVIGRAVRYIREHFAEDITLDEVSREINISPYYFSRLFKQETGENFIEFLTQTRIQKAKEYLSNPAYSIKEVCAMCGYSDPNYFSRIFRKYEGVSPSDWRG